MKDTFLNWLKNPNHYPCGTRSIEVIQTHISVVCIADNFVYKIKKPIKFSFLDFSTLDLRRFYCDEEIRLNRRLCKDIYLEVIPIFKDTDGYSFSSGDLEDWAVVMKRLPTDRLMSNCLNKPDFDLATSVKHIAEQVASFHGRSEPTSDILSAGSPDHLIEKIEGNFAEDYTKSGVDCDLVNSIEKAFNADIPALRTWLTKRSENNKIVEGHGDLHSGNIFLTDPPTIFDCIEFAPAFRCGDVAVENAFITMDLKFQGRFDLAETYLATYLETTSDRGQLDWLPLLQSYQAMVRFKVAVLTGQDSSLSPLESDKQLALAKSYLPLAAALIVEQQQNPIYMVCGLPGSGKSYLCREIKKRFNWEHIASDLVRKELAGIDEHDPLPEKFYRSEFSQKTYLEMKNRATIAAKTKPVLVDANFPTLEARRAFQSSVNQPVIAIWIQCDDETTRERLTQRATDPDEISDAGIAVYDQLQKRFEPPSEIENPSLIKLDGSQSAEFNTNLILKRTINTQIQSTTAKHQPLNQGKSIAMKAIKNLQGDVDELILQIDLGKREAIDKVEQAKEKLHSISKSLIESRESVSKPVKQKIGELQVQLSLGKMETRDIYYDQLKDIKSAIKEANESVRETEHKAADEFRDASNRLLDRISLLGFQIEMAEKRVADEIRASKTKTKSGLLELKERIQECMEKTDEKSHEAVDDCHTAYTDIVSNLKTLFKK